MKELIGEDDLLNRLTGVYELAQIYRNIDDNHLDDFADQWLPLIRSRYADFGSLTAAADGNVQDARWMWDQIVMGSENRLDVETYAVECGGVTQGLMKVITTYRARSASQLHLDLVYIDRLASAPWNRTRFTSRPKYRGVGELLFGTAISLSADLEFKGRVGLHSLPSSESWYRDVCGMTDLGPDPAAEGLHYFEITEDAADAFIKGRQP